MALRTACGVLGAASFATGQYSGGGGSAGYGSGGYGGGGSGEGGYSSGGYGSSGYGSGGYGSGGYSGVGSAGGSSGGYSGHGDGGSGSHHGGGHVQTCTTKNGTFCCNHLEGLGLSGAEAGNSVEECYAKCLAVNCTSGYWHPAIDAHEAHCKLYLPHPHSSFPEGSADPFCKEAPHAPQTKSFACGGHMPVDCADDPAKPPHEDFTRCHSDDDCEGAAGDWFGPWCDDGRCWLGREFMGCQLHGCEARHETWYTENMIECFECRENKQGATKRAECKENDDCEHYHGWDGAECVLDADKAEMFPMHKCFNWRAGSIYCAGEGCSDKQIWSSGRGTDCWGCEEHTLSAMKLAEPRKCVKIPRSVADRLQADRCDVHH